MYASGQNSTSTASGNSTTTATESSNQTSTTTNSTHVSTGQNSTTTSTSDGTAQTTTTQNITSVITISGEPLLPSSSNITRSFSFPAQSFENKVVSASATITWSTNGVVEISDNRGYRYSVSIPVAQGKVTLFQNSTVINQKVIGPELQYDIYWWAVKNPVNGYVDRYKFLIAGTSAVNSSSILLDMETGAEQHFHVDESSDMILATNTAYVNNTTSAPVNGTANVVTLSNDAMQQDDESDREGLGIDWSDATSTGYLVKFDTVNSLVEIPVGKTFVIDPYIVYSSGTAVHSPAKAYSFDIGKKPESGIHVKLDKKIILAPAYAGHVSDFALGKGDRDTIDVHVNADKTAKTGIHSVMILAKHETEPGHYHVFGYTVVIDIQETSTK